MTLQDAANEFNKKTPEEYYNELFIEALDIIGRRAHSNAVEKGFWEVDQNIGNKVALIHSELSEFFEGFRKGDEVNDEHCPGFSNQAIELADIVIRIMDLAGHLEINLGAAIIAKMSYNKTRPHLHGKRF